MHAAFAKKIMIAFVFMGFLMGGAPVGAETPPTPEKRTVQKITLAGWVERVMVPKLDSQFQAKLDTGATTTSMHANVLTVKKPKQDGNNTKKSLVVFEVEDEKGNKRVLERELVRWVNIKSRQDDKSYRRPVVKMVFCLSGYAINEEVNLADRSNFEYPVLVGRNMLKQENIVVDSSRKFVTYPNCPSDDE